MLIETLILLIGLIGTICAKLITLQHGHESNGLIVWAQVALPDVLFGAGTILNHKAVGQAIESGAEFIVSPNTKADVMEQTHLMGKVSVPGAYTPTEVALAMDLYADIVKLFPAGGLGPGYIRELKGPFDQLNIMPTGGVNADNILEYFKAGVCAVAAGGSLVNDALVDAGDYTEITRRARELRDAVDAAREELG